MELAAVLVLLGLVMSAVVVVGLYLSRQRTLSARVGSFSCALRSEGDVEGSWTPGIAQYATGRLLWWRTLSLAPRPAHSWSRADLTILDRTSTDDTDESGQPMLRVECCHGSAVFELTMSAAAFAGLVSWLESGPRPVGRVV